MMMMLFRHICRLRMPNGPVAAVSLVTGRSFSSDKKYVTVEVDSEMEDVAVVKMKKKPVNSLCSDHLHQLATTFEELKKDKKVRAMILTSSFPGIFSAGLDLLSMYGRNYDEIYSFWSNFQKAWINLYGSPLITVAAVNGHSPAGGCLLAMSCDYRVMAEGKFTIGLNEAKVGIVAPPFMKNTMLNLVGFRETERALQSGKMFTSVEAQNIGLIDDIVPMDELMSTCRGHIKTYHDISDHARSLTKNLMREETLNLLRSKLHEDADFTAKFLSQDVFQKALEKYVQALAAKKK